MKFGDWSILLTFGDLTESGGYYPLEDHIVIDLDGLEKGILSIIRDFGIPETGTRFFHDDDFLSNSYMLHEVTYDIKEKKIVLTLIVDD